MTTLDELGPTSLADRPPPTARQGWAALGAVVSVALVHLAPAAGLAPGALDADLGIQWHLGAETARGAIPLIDFEHTWNVASWYFNAALHRVAGGDPSTWLYLWGRVFGPALAAVTAVGVLWRLRFRAEWILIGAGSWLALSHVIHSKYTIPVVWVFVLAPTGRGASTTRAVAVRAALAGLTFLSQVELAVLLGAGVVLFDLIGRDPWSAAAGELRARVLRAAAVPAGIALALVAELAVYRLLGQPPGEVLRQLFSNAAETAEGFTYGYPLLSAPSLRPKLFVASLLVAFVPAVWRRLTAPARLVACLHLAQALIAIRRPDPAHVDAATTLLGLLVVLVVNDLVTDPRGVGHLRWPRGRWDGRRVVAAVVGAVVVAAAVVAAVSVESLLALALPTVLLAGLAVVTPRWRADAGAVSLGAGAVVVAVLLASTAGGIAASLRAGDALAVVEGVAADIAPDLDRCTGGDRVVWIVPGPLPLYDALEAENPTPWTVFWYGFTAEHDRVRDRLAEGSLPGVLQVGHGWPPSFGDLGDDLQVALEPCAEGVSRDGQPYRIWVD
ncbi:hypothetical protein [Euzebya sp.]|uniref:hypothetical protein n=1 Tax=Euzebya sp. TaxID=1971409 RepID=UPI00351977BD